MTTDEKAARAANTDGQKNRTPKDSTPQIVPASAAWDLPLNQAREIAYAALRLFEGLEAESWTASHRLEMRLQAFQQRMIDATIKEVCLFDPQPPADQGGIGAAIVISAESSVTTPISSMLLGTTVPVTAAESMVFTPAEAQARVAAKRAARLAQADPWRGEFDEPAEAFGGEPK